MSESKQYNINTYIDKQIKNTYKSKTKKIYGNEKRSQKYHEIIDPALGVDVTKYNSFFDIGACPGAHTTFIFNHNPKIKGYGISLHPDEDGYKLNDDLMADERYQFKYFNLLTDNPTVLNDIPKVDLVLTDCFINHNKDNPKFKNIRNSWDLTRLARNLQCNSFRIGLSKLNKGGDIQLVFPFRWDIGYLIDTITFLRNHFKIVKYYKDSDIVADTSVVWIFAMGFHDNVTVRDLNNYMTGNIWSPDILQQELKNIDEIYRPINLFILKNL